MMQSVLTRNIRRIFNLKIRRDIILQKITQILQQIIEEQNMTGSRVISNCTTVQIDKWSSLLETSPTLPYAPWGLWQNSAAANNYSHLMSTRQWGQWEGVNTFISYRKQLLFSSNHAIIFIADVIEFSAVLRCILFLVGLIYFKLFSPPSLPYLILRLIPSVSQQKVLRCWRCSVQVTVLVFHVIRSPTCAPLYYTALSRPKTNPAAVWA